VINQSYRVLKAQIGLENFAFARNVSIAPSVTPNVRRRFAEIITAIAYQCTVLHHRGSAPKFYTIDMSSLLADKVVLLYTDGV